MQRYLVAFASREGQTEKIAHHVARRVEDDGSLVRLIDIRANESEAGADEYDAMLIAGSVHVGRFDPELAAFITRHIAALRRCPSAFLPVSLSAASQDESEKSAIDEIAQGYIAELGWVPDAVHHVAGAVHDRKLNALERTVLHAIVDSKGVERQPSGDTELTDWAELDAFVRSFEALTRSRQCGGPAEPESGA
jgi:menaquinone-dependent protoporphyrinogen oxidase